MFAVIQALIGFIIHALPSLPDSSDKGLERDMLRMILVSVQRSHRFKFRVQQDIVGALEAGLRDHYFEGQYPGHEARTVIEQRFHLRGIGRLVCSLGMVL